MLARPFCATPPALVRVKAVPLIVASGVIAFPQVQVSAMVRRLRLLHATIPP